MNNYENSIKYLREQLDPVEVKRELGRRNLLDFTKYTFPTYSANWHHIVLCNYLEQWIAGDIRRLMVFMPPRTGKSELVSRRLPAFIFGKYSDSTVMATSYGADLAGRMNRDVQRIIDSDLYHDLFPSITLSNGKDGYKRTADVFEIPGFEGSYKCSGVGGGITGMGYNYGIIDDPIKDRLEANSATFRDRVWDWYTSTFYTRRANDNACILITLTRWHEDDLAGRLLRLQETDPQADQWVVVKFPMIAEGEKHADDPREIGEALWPERFSIEKLLPTKINMGPYDWSALMQQNPTPLEGARVKREWLKDKYVDIEKLKLEDLKVTLGVDLAISEKEAADFTAVAVLGRSNLGNIYVLDIARIKGSFRDQISLISVLANKWKPFVVGIEDQNYQRVMVQELSRETTFNVKGIPVTRDKFSRFGPLENRYEQGLIYHVRGLPAYFETELFGFGAGAEHDDIPDAMSIAFEAFGGDQQIFRVPSMPVVGRGTGKRR